MAKRNNHLFTLAVLFIAVLLAYRQRNKNPPYTPPSTTDNIYYPSPTTATTASTMTHLPHPHISEARQLPKQVFALLSRIPSPLPLIWALIIWIYHLILSISTPIRIVFDALSVIFAPSSYFSPQHITIWSQSQLESHSQLDEHSTRSTSLPPRPFYLVPLSEDDVSIRHVLEIFAPSFKPPEGSAKPTEESRIASKIVHILSQLPEPFDLVRFNQLIGEETWDDDSERYISDRQTLLTSLISPPSCGDEEGESERLDGHGPLVFLSQTAENPKLVVLSNAHEYLQPGSSLEQSISYVAADGRKSRTSLLISTSDPSIVNEAVWSALDYAACGGTTSSAWYQTLQHRLTTAGRSASRPSDIPNASETQLLILPTRGFGAVGQGWETTPMYATIDMQELERTMTLPLSQEVETTADPEDVQRSQICGRIMPRQHPVDPPQTLEPLLPDAGLPTTPENLHPTIDVSSYSSELQSLVAAILNVADGKPNIYVGYAAVRDVVGNRKRVKSLGWRNFSYIVEAAVSKGYIVHAGEHGKGGLLLLKASPFASQANKAEMLPVETLASRTGSPSTLTTSLHSSMVSEDTQSQASDVDPNAFPVPFRLLIVAILELSGGRPDVLIDYVELRSKVGNFRAVRAMGWRTFTQLIREAVAAGYVDHVVRQGLDRVKLRADPFAGPGWIPPTDPSTTPITRPWARPAVSIDHTQYPPNFQKLMAAVISLSRGVFDTPVSAKSVRTLVGKKEEIRKMGWVTFSSLVDAACEKGYIRTGGLEGDKRIMLLPFNPNA
ncbi:SubName: Full=Uncharacterized protein {ECO:0000313/EMBL:CCA74035.1} [Serendipita indica DSM 11827]|nr:SubName: Full=Uncharacterized protein {ECO:0000313/EMBL:CCA74035.1} [Serendipita indica DSM 11827]